MGEFVVSSEAGMEFDVRETEVPPLLTENMNSAEEDGDAAATAAAFSSSAVMWERFLPKMAVRVLLVESDVSTRQIIAALLRKCSYRVAAVSDGLKAWELLKGRPHNIDLILTEVDLPSVSGYALLSLIMEHEVCKHIPVIMMSSHDSVSTVYKCMLKGASDFLVKPLRKNELRNLWQHVWRKQASSSASGPGPPDETTAQQKVEATAENNAVSNHSSGYIVSLKRNRECIEKGSDAQSSCTKPDVETEGTNTKRVSEPKSDKCIANSISTQEECHQESTKGDAAHDDVAGESQVAASINADYATVLGQGKNFGDGWEQVNVIGQNSENNHVLEKSSAEAIDFIGAFDNYLKDTFRSSSTNVITNKFEVLPILDLSLRRSNPSGLVNQVNDEGHGLNHSDASAFSRYINKPLHAHMSSSPSTCNHHKDHETNYDKQFSNFTPDYDSDTNGPTLGHVSVATIQPGPSEVSLPSPQKTEISLPIAVRGVRFDINAYGSVIPQTYSTPSPSPSPMTSPGTAHPSESFTHLYQYHSWMDQRSGNAIDQTDYKHGHNLEDRANMSPANDRSGNSSFCNGNLSHHHNMGSGSNGKINSASVVKGASEGGNEEALPVHEGASHKSMQREAALIKFRLKRKDRCFDKKVRYESRKKLAEQRPRVKGQFVRQVPNDLQSGNS